ncbi:MAG: hypothetical protein HQ463_02280 [Bacteroidetes bacterium]|nr:hypothetical protein [Bacteroidota bacterium]
MFYKHLILLIICLMHFTQTKAQGSIWGKCCESGVSSYTSRNVFYNNGNYFGELGLIMYGGKNDTFNIKSYKANCTILSGKWKYKNKKIYSNFR